LKLVGNWLETGWKLVGNWLETGWKLVRNWLETGWKLVDLSQGSFDLLLKIQQQTQDFSPSALSRC
jgi:hypothetical protein